MKKIVAVFLLMWIGKYGTSQIVGGERAFEYLRFTTSPHTTALGGMVVINPGMDVMMSANNPALLKPEFHTQLGLNYNLYYAQTKVMNMLYAHHSPKIETTFSFGIQYLKYPNMIQTDALGNVLGEIHAADYSVYLSASRHYLERWRYGATLKLASSQLSSYRASALLMDVGVAYTDTNNQFYMGAVVKNAGFVLKKYDPSLTAPSVPVDIQLSFMKKFKKAPFSLSVLGHHLYQWDIRYDNPADKINNQLIIGDTTTEKEKTYFADKLFRHMVFALEIQLGKRIEISGGYNHLRRSELGYSEKKGMSGFSYGAGVYLNKFILHYARSHYHIAGAYNELGINFQLNKLFGLGSFGKKINWSQTFE